MAFFLISSMQIFSQLCLIELLGLLIGLELLELWNLIYLRLMTGFRMLVFFKSLSLTEFQVRYLALFLLSSAIDGFECQASDLWQQLELASELESDLQDTVNWGKKWLVDFNAGKTQLVLFNRSNNTGSIDLKMNGSVLEEKSYFKMLTLTLSSKLACHSYI